jgi:hypothetical protein
MITKKVAICLSSIVKEDNICLAAAAAAADKERTRNIRSWTDRIDVVILHHTRAMHCERKEIRHFCKILFICKHSEDNGPRSSFRGRLHVPDSVYESLYDSVHDLRSKGLGFRLSFGHQLQLIDNKYQDDWVEN